MKYQTFDIYGDAIKDMHRYVMNKLHNENCIVQGRNHFSKTVKEIISYVVYNDEFSLTYKSNTHINTFKSIQKLLSDNIKITDIIMFLKHRILYINRLGLYSGMRRDGTTIYRYYNGFLHCDDGPSKYETNPSVFIHKYNQPKWYIHGKEYDEDSYQLHAAVLHANK